MDMGEGEGSESGVVHGGFVRVVAKGDLYLPTYGQLLRGEEQGVALE